MRDNLKVSIEVTNKPKFLGRVVKELCDFAHADSYTEALRAVRRIMKEAKKEHPTYRFGGVSIEWIDGESIIHCKSAGERVFRSPMYNSIRMKKGVLKWQRN